MDSDGRAKKRLRVSMACEECRQRKTRCDGRHPFCSRRNGAAVPRTFDSSTSPESATQSVDTIDLLSRVRELENALESLTKPGSAVYRSTAGKDTAQSDKRPIQQIDRHHDSPDHAFPRHSLEGGKGQEPEKEENVDGMGIVTLSGSQTSCSYFGDSANIAFVRELSCLLDTLTDTKQQASRGFSTPSRTQQVVMSKDGDNHPGLPPFYSERHESLSATLRHLPPEPEATMVLKEYFKTIGLFFPCIHEGTFLAAYKSFREGSSGQTSRSWLSLLFIIFAVTYRTRTVAYPPDTMETLSRKYFQIALDLALPDAIIQSSLEIVQLLCLFTCYLQGSTNPGQTWSFHVLAVKAAMQIGLHNPDAFKHLPPLQQELHKRTWFWCAVNDGIASSYLGRPPMVPNPLITDNLPRDMSELISSPGQSEAVRTLSLLYYNSKIRLTVLTSDILAQLYGNNTTPTAHQGILETLHIVLGLSSKLTKWRQSVPAEIRPSDQTAVASSMAPRPVHVQRFQTMLSLLFYHALFLLHRPLLLQFLRVPHNSDGVDDLSSLRDTGYLTLKRCVRACHQGIALGRRIVNEASSETGLCRAWWLTNSLTFTASMMHFTALLINMRPLFSNLISSEDISLIRADLRDVIETQDRLDKRNRVVSRCQECLHRFLEMYDSINHRTTTTTTSPPVIGRECHSAAENIGPETGRQVDFLSSTSNTSMAGSLPTASLLERNELDWSWYDLGDDPLSGLLPTSLFADPLLNI